MKTVTHYADRAEDALTNADAMAEHGLGPQATYWLAVAQVNATLAVAAATESLPWHED